MPARGEPISPLRYHGDDTQGLLWQTPPVSDENVPDELPTHRPPVIGVLGSSGYKASWQTGIVDALEDIAQPIRWDLASGGTMPGLAIAAGINKRWRRIMNAGAPGHAALATAAGLRWPERLNLDLAGVYDLSAIEAWLGSWLAWAGVRTFADLRYRPGERHPPGVAHRVGICVSMWRSDRPYPRPCDAEELTAPQFVHRAFRWAFFGRQFPFRKFHQLWVPDTVADHLPWLTDVIDEHSPAWWARISMSQWPACVPTVLQDPETLQLVFLADGGHIDNQPSLFNTGRRPAFPLVNPRLAQNWRQLGRPQHSRDVRRMPFGTVIRLPRTPETACGALAGARLTWSDRDAMWERGVVQGREHLGPAIAELLERPNTADYFSVEVPGLHGFQAIAAIRRPHTKRIFARRS